MSDDVQPSESAQKILEAVENGRRQCDCDELDRWKLLGKVLGVVAAVSLATSIVLGWMLIAKLSTTPGDVIQRLAVTPKDVLQKVDDLDKKMSAEMQQLRKELRGDK